MIFLLCPFVPLKLCAWTLINKDWMPIVDARMAGAAFPLAYIEPEITTPIDLCDTGGRLKPAARGWARRPLVRAKLSGHWPRKKRWNFWNFICPRFVFSVTLANIDYAAFCAFFFIDFESGEKVAGMSPAWPRSVQMPERVEQPAHFRSAVIESEHDVFNSRSVRSAKPRFGHGHLVVPGGSDYTELLLTLPQRYVQRRFHETTPIGISLYPDDGEDVDTLLKNADAAMYHAKEKGKNNFQFFTEPLNVEALERFTLETSLRKAKENNELQLYYQPQFDVHKREIIGVESLIRWMRPERGMLFPDTFIPIAQDSGLIVSIGEWVLRTACKQNKAWQIAGYKPIYVTVNISSTQFEQNDFARSVALALSESDLNPQYLEIELTESILMKPIETTSRTLKELKALGVKLAIDDFGTGYSSLGYLKRLPIDTLKIDRSFVRDIMHDPDDRAIVQAIIALARALNLKGELKD